MEIAVVGGGAAGMTAALTAKRNGVSVTVYEKNDRVLKKLLMTGNGKCNFTNLDFSKDYFRSDSCPDIRTYFDTFGVKETIRFLKDWDLWSKIKTAIYTLTANRRPRFRTCYGLRDREGVRSKVGAEVKKLQKKDGRFTVETKEGKETYDRIILACGSKAGPKGTVSGSGYLLSASLGHSVLEPVPALVQLRCRESFFKQLAGVRTECGLTLYLDGKKEAYERGELQLTDYGISGIPVFQFSRYAAKALSEKRNVAVSMDFLPCISKEAYDRLIHNRYETKKGQKAEEFFLGITNKKILQLLIKLAGLRSDEKIGEENRKKWEKVYSLLRNLETQISECNPFENAQVCAGGVSMEEVTETLESTIIPGLFFAGELLDIDGRCGGYNLQWAWTSGHIAGENASKKKSKKQADGC